MAQQTFDSVGGCRPGRRRRRPAGRAALCAVLLAVGVGVAACSSGSQHPNGARGDTARRSAVGGRSVFEVGDHAIGAAGMGRGGMLVIDAQSTAEVSGSEPAGCQAAGIYDALDQAGRQVPAAEAVTVHDLVVYRCNSAAEAAELRADVVSDMTMLGSASPFFASGRAPKEVYAWEDATVHALRVAEGFGWGSQARLGPSETAINLVVSDGDYLFGVWSMAPSPTAAQAWLDSFTIIR